MPNQPTATIKCPRCKRPQRLRTPDALYKCDGCGGLFDGEASEGGDYYSDPSRRLEKQEQRQQQQRKVRR